MSEPTTVRRKPTLRTLSSSLSTASVSSSTGVTADAAMLLSDRAAAMSERAKQREPLTPDEVDAVVHSLDNLVPADHAMDRAALAQLLREEAHLPHTDWARTERNAARLGNILTRTVDARGGIHDNEALRQVLERILRDGNWDGAAGHTAAAGSALSAPTAWAVLVTGVNGIRKTTSLYMPWFAALLREALVPPEDGAEEATTDVETLDLLPTGRNSFFRQLDHMIATLCNEEFAELYRLTAQVMDQCTEGRSKDEPSPQAVAEYSNLKAAIFARYRTLSEWLGAWLLQEAQHLGLNCLLETSGRDVAMFHYVDHFFPAATPASGHRYRKLALHFQINSLDLAKRSVDERMSREIVVGREAVESQDAWSVIDANAGGPYGSSVLEGVQRDSDKVWREQILSGQVGRDWYKATIQINAHSDAPWTAQAVRPDGTLGTVYSFDKQLKTLN